MEVKIKTVLLCLMLVWLSFIYCAGQSSVSPLTIEQLKNAEYQSELPISGRAKLKNGFYNEQIVPNSATQLQLWLDSLVVFGDLNDDTVEDAAAILVGTAGGSGTYYYLVAVSITMARPGMSPPNRSEIGSLLKQLKFNREK